MSDRDDTPRRAIEIQHAITRKPDGSIEDKVVQAQCSKCGFVAQDPMDVYRACFCQRALESGG